MQITPHIHALRINFDIPLPDGKRLPRLTWVYLILCPDHVTLIDAAVAGSWGQIEDYLRKLGRPVSQLRQLLLTHEHPDHIGAARSVRAATGCRVLAHEAARPLVEDTAAQFRARPVPGFATLVEGDVTVDEVLPDGRQINLADGHALRVIHTPGHSRGQIALLHETDGVLITGDSVLPQGEMPIYDDPATLRQSLGRLLDLPAVQVLLSSLAAQPIYGWPQVRAEIERARHYLDQIDLAVHRVAGELPDADAATLTRQVIKDLGLPPAAVNPITAKAIRQHLAGTQ